MTYLVYVRRLLRDSYRQDGKVKHRTIANVSSCTPEEIQSLKPALRHKGNLDATVQEGLDELKTLCATELRIHGKPLCNSIPQPRASVQRFLEKAQVVLPDALPHRGVIAATRKKLPARRKTR